MTLSDSTGATTISRPGARLLTIKTGFTSRIVFVNASVTATITGLTLSEGTSEGDLGGGGAGLNFGTVTLQRMVFQNNQSTVGNGGAITNAGTLNIDQSLFVNNSVSGVPGADGRSTGLTNVTVTGNRSDNDYSGGETGGGLSRLNSTVTLNKTQITGNFRGTGTTRDDAAGAVDAASANNLTATAPT